MMIKVNKITSEGNLTVLLNPEDSNGTVVLTITYRNRRFNAAFIRTLQLFLF